MDWGVWTPQPSVWCKVLLQKMFYKIDFRNVGLKAVYTSFFLMFSNITPSKTFNLEKIKLGILNTTNL